MTPGPRVQTSTSGIVTRFDALFRLARSAREDNLSEVFEAVAETVRVAGGFGAVCFNLYRPAWDDYEVVLVMGSEAAREALMGSTDRRETWERHLLGEAERLPGVYLLAGDATIRTEIPFHEPDIPPSDDPAAWRASDFLLVVLTDATGAPLGILSVDEPATGRRPSEDELRLLRTICSHAEQILESAHAASWASEHERTLSRLLDVSPTLGASASAGELLDAVSDTVVPGLGFERIAAYLRSGVDHARLDLCTHRGWDGDRRPPATVRVEAMEALFTADTAVNGCWLLAAREVDPDDVAASPRSRRNGRGPVAWDDHCLLLPIRDDLGELAAVFVIEDPVDRLLPRHDTRRAIRLLIDQASSALAAIAHRERLRYLADHDPLTGVRNRRGLSDLVARFSDVALLFCDLDRFKEINDRHGHDVGDRVLERFGDLLRELARESDILVRLGGEEFCVVLPGTDAAGALLVAERLRRETSARMGDLLPDRVTVSIGVAATKGRALDPRELLAAADRALYTAKAGGRDRSVSAG